MGSSGKIVKSEENIMKGTQGQLRMKEKRQKQPKTLWGSEKTGLIGAESSKP